MNFSSSSDTSPLFKQQVLVCAVFALLLSGIIGALYWQHRQREWMLRCEQAQHRLNVTFELISREVERVRSDVLYLANRAEVRRFVLQSDSGRASLESDCALFVEKKGLYDQLRLLDANGYETIRLNFDGARATAVATESLQDKSSRYYVQAAMSLQPGEIFVSDFDLNVEHGEH